MDKSSPNYHLEAVAQVILGLEYPNHFNEWGILSETEKRLLVIASRDHGKSTFFDLILPITRLIRNKAYKILIASYSESQVHKLTGAIKSLFESKPLLKEFSPKSEDDWSKSRMLFKDGSLIESLTFGQAGRGSHYNLGLIDDPVKDFGGIDPEEQSRYMTRTITPMIKPTGQIIMTGNYVYDGDLIDRTEKNKAYVTKKYPAITNGKPLWPEYWSLENLAKRRAEIESSDDPVGFDREYLLHKIDSKAQFFRRPMFHFYERSKLPEKMSIVGAWDPAFTLNGDFNALMVTGTGEDKKTYLLDYTEFRSDNVAASIEEFFRLTEKYDVPYWVLETIGAQTVLKENLNDAMRAKNKYVGIVEVKHHIKRKTGRIMGLQPRIESGSLLFDAATQDDVIKQFLAFPRGKNDDCIDAMSFLMGHWDSPRPATLKAPEGSFDYWRGQVEQESNGWYEGLTK